MTGMKRSRSSPDELPPPDKLLGSYEEDDRLEASSRRYRSSLSFRSVSKERRRRSSGVILLLLAVVVVAEVAAEGLPHPSSSWSSLLSLLLLDENRSV